MIQHFTPDGRRVFTAAEAAALRGEAVKTVQTRLLRAGIEPAGQINAQLNVYYPEDLKLEEVMTVGAFTEEWNPARGFVTVTADESARRALAGARLVADRAPMLSSYSSGYSNVPLDDRVTDGVHIPASDRLAGGLHGRAEDRMFHAARAGWVRDVSNDMRPDWDRWADPRWVLTKAGLAALADGELCDRLAAHVRDWAASHPHLAEAAAHQLGVIDAARP